MPDELATASKPAAAQPPEGAGVYIQLSELTAPTEVPQVRQSPTASQPQSKTAWQAVSLAQASCASRVWASGGVIAGSRQHRHEHDGGGV